MQALFDSIAAGSVPAPEPVAARGPDPSGDSDDLQALFDSVAAQAEESAPAEVAPEAGSQEEAVFARLGFTLQ